MNKLKELQELEKKMAKREFYTNHFIGKMVFGEGNVDARIMFVGEAPGKQEAENGRPFIGRSGQLLRKFIRSLELAEEDVYITSPVKYLPKHGTPKKKEIEQARVDFMKQIDIIDPQIIVLLGKTAIYAVLEEDIPILKNHGDIIERGGRTYLLTLHPAAGLRFPKYQKLIQEDFSKLKGYL